MVNKSDICIIGAGPVGLFGIFECGMLKMSCTVVDSLEYTGGQCTALYPEKPIYDIAGFPSIEAAELIDNLEKQAAPFSPKYLLGQQVTEFKKLDEEFYLTTSKGSKIICNAVIVAAGCGAFGPNRPPMEGLQEYEEKGSVRYMVRNKKDFAGKRVAIAGGGDSAVDWANILADVADKLYVVHRRPKFRAAPESVEKMQKLEAEGKIEMVIPYQLDKLKGSGGVIEALTVSDLDGNSRDLEIDNLLCFYGLAMELGPIANWGLNLDKNHIEVQQHDCQTNIEGVYAVGDICDYKGKLKLIACGFSEAAMAAHSAYNRIFDKPLHFEYSTTKGVPGA
jgi:thioredoxin reductase (NADPH)